MPDNRTHFIAQQRRALPASVGEIQDKPAYVPVHFEEGRVDRANEMKARVNSAMSK
jgi:hypothetical protein